MIEVFQKIPTTPEVWAVMHASHRTDLTVFASFSDPTGTFQGGPGEYGRMETGYGIRGTDCPLLWACSTWRIGAEGDYKKHDEKHEYWLCIAKEVFE